MTRNQSVQDNQISRPLNRRSSLFGKPKLFDSQLEKQESLIRKFEKQFEEIFVRPYKDDESCLVKSMASVHNLVSNPFNNKTLNQEDNSPKELDSNEINERNKARSEIQKLFNNSTTNIENSSGNGVIEKLSYGNYPVLKLVAFYKDIKGIPQEIDTLFNQLKLDETSSIFNEVERLQA